MTTASLPDVFKVLLLMFAGWVNRNQQEIIEYLKEENRVLREQLGGRRCRFTDDQRRRLSVKGKALGRAVLKEVAGIVTPDTILRWYRTLVAKKYDGTQRRRQGRPRTRQTMVELILRIANENPGFGYTRLRGALSHLGHEIGRNTIQRILSEHGIEPAPERGERTPWKTFLKAHWEALAATDFFTVEVLTLAGLVRYWVFFVMDLKTRRVEIAGIARDPHGGWMKQIARNLTDAVDGFLRETRYLIMDRDPLFTPAFRRMLKDSGVEPVRLPAKSPNLNAYAERFVLSIKTECLDRMVLLGERHLRTAVREYMAHYLEERNHQGLENNLISPRESVGSKKSRVVCRERLGGMLRYYYRQAA